jgi:hypothetical protein
MPRPFNYIQRLRTYNDARKEKETNQSPIEEEIQAFEMLPSDSEDSEDDCLILEMDNDESRARAMKLESVMELKWWHGADNYIKKPNRLGDGTSERYIKRKTIEITEDDVSITIFTQRSAILRCSRTDARSGTII